MLDPDHQLCWMCSLGKCISLKYTLLYLYTLCSTLLCLFLMQLTPFSSRYTAGTGRERSPDQSFARGSGHLCTAAGPSLCKQWPHPTQGVTAATGAAGRPVPLCGCQCWGGPGLPVSALQLPIKAGPADTQCRLPCGRAVPAAALTAVSPEVCHPGLLCCKIDKKGKDRKEKKRKAKKRKEKKRKEKKRKEKKRKEKKRKEKKRKAKKRKDCAVRHQFDEKPSVIPGCPGVLQDRSCEMIMTTWWLACVASCNGWNGF